MNRTAMANTMARVQSGTSRNMSTMERIIIFVRGEDGVGLFPNKNPKKTY